jgi:hypothetical protein
MSFADDLLEQSFHLARRDIESPKQAGLRRAVSTAYYSLFHLLIDEAVSAWAVERQRSVLARTFDHTKMKGICDSVLRTAAGGGKPPSELVVIARTFIELQERRHIADYDNSKNWSPQETLAVLDRASDAFDAWRTIRGHDAAQDFLLDLFLPKRVR